MKNYNKKYASKFYCFSPPVMVATFCIEIILAAYTVYRYKMSVAGRLIVLLLLSLSLFQIAEYFICHTTSLVVSPWARVGYVAITLLPVLAIHLFRAITGRGSKYIVWLAYASAVFFVLMFGFSKTAFLGQVCGGNYVIFHLSHSVSGMYYTYYFSWLLFGIGQSLYFARKVARNMREALFYQVLGFLTFLLPTGLVNLLNPSSSAGIPSIMCGFAVIYAIILVVAISPAVLKLRKHQDE